MVIASGDQVTSDQDLSQTDAAISLPASLFEVIDDPTNVGLFFARYSVSTLFPVNGGADINTNAPRQTVVGSHVLSATVGLDTNFQNLKEPVTVLLHLQVPEGRVNATVYYAIGYCYDYEAIICHGHM